MQDEETSTAAHGPPTVANPPVADAPAAIRGGLGRYTVIWFGQIVSILGSGLIGFALAVQIYQDTGSVTRYALIGLSISLPNLLISPFAGVLADRFDRRKVLILARFGAALINLLLFRLVLLDPLPIWWIYGIIMLVSVMNAFALPAFSASTTLLVGKKHLARASAMLQMGASLSSILAPSLAGILLVTVGLPIVVLLNFASYLIAAITLLMVRIPKPQESEEGRRAQGTVYQQTGHGWRFIRERRGLFLMLSIFAVFTFFATGVQVMLTPLVLTFGDPVTLGVVLSAGAAGTLLGSILMTVTGGPPAGRRVKAILWVLTYNAFLIAICGGIEPTGTLVAGVAFFYLLAVPVIASSAQAIWQSKVPTDLQGRVFAVRIMVAGSAPPIAMVLAGPLADFVFEPMMAEGGVLASSVGQLIGVGPGRGIGLMLVLSGFAMLALVTVAWRLRSLRHLEEDLPDVIEDEDDGAPNEAEQHAERESRERLGRLGRAPAAAMLILLLAAAGGAFLAQRPSIAVVENMTKAAVEGVSLQRIAAHVEAIASVPHPVGSAAHAAVVDHVTAELDALGLGPEVQSTLVNARRGRIFQVVEVANVLGRLPGTASSTGPGAERAGAVLLMAHHDSVPTSPGAADNGAAVGTLLETARVLSAEAAAGRGLLRDVIFFFPDAEELGLHGARAFLQQHPWAKDVAMVINFDARGHGGPVYMFEAGPQSGSLIPHLVEAVPHPVASSLMNEIYQRLPNDTDFTLTSEAGLPGFNLAFIEGLTHYHTDLDRPEELSLASVAHQASYALGLARHLGDLDPAELEAAREHPDRVYFNLFGPFMVHYPPSIAFASAALALAFLIFTLVSGLRRRRLSPFGLVQGFLALLAAMVGVPVLITLVWFVMRDAAELPILMGSTPGAGRLMLAFALLGGGGFVLFLRQFRRIISPLDLAGGALVWWALLVVVTSGAGLGVEANFVFVWPLLAATGALFYLLRRQPEDLRPVATTAILGGAALVPLFLVVPLIAALYIGLQSFFQLSGVVLLVEILLLGLLIPQLEMVSAAGRSRLVAGLAVGAAAWLLVSAVVEKPEPPFGQSSVLYAWNAESGERHWFSFDRAPRPWTEQFGFTTGERGSFRSFTPTIGRELLTSPAPKVEIPRPVARILGFERLPTGMVEYRVHLRTAPGSRIGTFWLEPADRVASVRFAGRSLTFPEAAAGPPPMIQRLGFAYDDEILVRLRGEDGETPTLVVVDQLPGLPPVPSFMPRPEGEMARPLLYVARSDVTLVRDAWPLEGRPVADQMRVPFESGAPQ